MRLHIPLAAAGLLRLPVAQAASAKESEHHLDGIYATCRGYHARNIVLGSDLIQADLDLVGPGCAVFGPDVAQLRLRVEYQTENRVRILIQDREGLRYQVPEDVIPRPGLSGLTHMNNSKLVVTWGDEFGFSVGRKSTGEVLFDASHHYSKIIFKHQFVRIKTKLPRDANIYGLGEHIDSFRLPMDNYTRTLWARDSGILPYGENLYGSHPVYFDHRSSTNQTHGVLFMSSDGMDIELQEEGESNSLEFKAIGGVLDIYFFAGPSPLDVARQYAEVVGTPAMVPYWSLGFHQCKYGYQDWFEVAEVITNYSAANIPLETMWTDIDYMDHRRVFSLDQDRFPISKMRGIVHHLHTHQQQYILMVDPAVAKWDYPAYSRGTDLDVFLKTEDGEYYQGVVWPGVTVFPDWLHPSAITYWIERFRESFMPATGIDIDGVWIDMNEPANFCRFLCEDAEAEARRLGLPPDPPPLRDPPRPLPGFDPGTAHPIDHLHLPIKYGPHEATRAASVPRAHKQREAYSSEEDVLSPPYRLQNGGPSGDLSDLTVRTDIVHANGLLEYDVHNLYGTMMGMVTRQAMLARRPLMRPFIVTRSTFVGAGRYVQKWLGDNASRWDHYRSSIAGMLNFASIFQMPMVGSDVCGFAEHATAKLCARWATLGAFQPFYRNHADLSSRPQEFYRWPVVADAARWAISTRYRLLDYLYTTLRRQSADGTPAVAPLWHLYPGEEGALGVDLQYFYGPCVLVSPVTEGEDATSVSLYLPDDVFYDLETGERLRGGAGYVTLASVPYDRIPLHIRGGCVVPLRASGANTTAGLREKGFELVVALGLDGTARGELFVDDGVSLDGGPAEGQVRLEFRYAQGRLYVSEGRGWGRDDDASSSDSRYHQKNHHHHLGWGGTLQARMEAAGVRIEGVKVAGTGRGGFVEMRFWRMGGIWTVPESAFPVPTRVRLEEEGRKRAERQDREERRRRKQEERERTGG